MLGYPTKGFEDFPPTFFLRATFVPSCLRGSICLTAVCRLPSAVKQKSDHAETKRGRF
jgi:hypothetical protein